MRITFDPVKHAETLRHRGLYFRDAAQVFDGPTLEAEDRRVDYGEVRIVAVGHLGDRMVVIVYTDRAAGRHIISMRKANKREQQRYRGRMDRSG